MKMKRLFLFVLILLPIVAAGCSSGDGDIVCEPNGGPCHSALVTRFHPISDAETALYFGEDVYTRAQGLAGASAANRWGTLYTPDDRGVFFVTVGVDWNGQVPRRCGAPGRLIFGSGKREPGVTTTDCAVYLPAEVRRAWSAPSALSSLCVDQHFRATACEATDVTGVFAFWSDSALAGVKLGDALSMPPVNETGDAR